MWDVFTGWCGAGQKIKSSSSADTYEQIFIKALAEGAGVGHKKRVDLTLLTFYGSKLRIVRGKKNVFWTRMMAEVELFEQKNGKFPRQYSLVRRAEYTVYRLFYWAEIKTEIKLGAPLLASPSDKKLHFNTQPVGSDGPRDPTRKPGDGDVEDGDAETSLQPPQSDVPRPPPHEEERGGSNILVYVSVLAAVVLGLLFYVAYKWWECASGDVLQGKGQIIS